MKTLLRAALVERTRDLVTLLLGTILVLAVLKLTLSRPGFQIEAEPPARTLSYHLVDTDFLMRCAVKHRAALEQSSLIAPEIRFAIFQLASAQSRIQ